MFSRGEPSGSQSLMFVNQVELSLSVLCGILKMFLLALPFAGTRGTPPASALFSSSPPGAFHFPIGYPTQPTINHLTTNLSNLSVGPPQPSATTRRDSFSSSGQVGAPSYGVQPQHQYLFMNFSQTPPAGSLGSSPNFFGRFF